MNKKKNTNFISQINSIQRFGLRKLSVGLTTVVLGATFLAFSSPVQAENNENNSDIVTSKKETETNSTQATSAAITSNKQNNAEAKDTQSSKTNQQTSTNTQKNSPFKVEIDTPSGTNNKYLMANNDTGAIQVKFSGDQDSYLFNNGDSFSISVENPDNLLKFSSNLPTFNAPLSDFKPSKNDDTYTFTYQGQNPFNLQEGNVTLNFTGNNDAVVKYNHDHHAANNQIVYINPKVTVAFPKQAPVNQNIAIGLYPYANIVDRQEMISGYPWQGKVVFTPHDSNGFKENNVTYTGPEESAKADIPEKDQQDARLMQYIINWNYGRGLEDPIVDPLNNVIAKLQFNDGQKILPHTIKVFKITDPSFIGTINPITHQIERKAIDKKTYDKLTACENEDPNFEKFLQDNISQDQSQISINQTGPFTVNDKDYSKQGAYFIQLDTLLDVKKNLPTWSLPNNGPSISYTPQSGHNINGSGDRNLKTQTFLGFNTASGTGSQVRENILVKYIDDDENKILDSDRLIEGVPNTSSKYSTQAKIKDFKVKHYLLVSDLTNGETLIFDSDNQPDNQVYEVHFKHDHTKEKVIQTVTETIHYYYKDAEGKVTTNHVFNDYTKSIVFTQEKDTDLVTNKFTENKWVPKTGNFEAVKSPRKDGYSFDKAEIATQDVLPSEKNLEFTVYYTKNKPDTPDQKPIDPNNKPTEIIPTPQLPDSQPNHNPEPLPEEPETIIPHSNEEPPRFSDSTAPNQNPDSTIDSEADDHTAANALTKDKHVESKVSQDFILIHKDKKKLPQTSNEKDTSNLAALAGLLIAGIGLTLFTKKRKI